MDKKIPRGVRNNNPLNIRIGNSWYGEVKNPTDSQFEQFVSMQLGLRAGFIILHRYMTRYHLTCIIDIVSRWAPPAENETISYAKHVATMMEIGVLDKIDFYDKHTMIELVYAMCFIECGVYIDKNVISQGYDLALKSIKS